MFELPDSLPSPDDDGSADHLVGSMLADLQLSSTAGKSTNLSKMDGVVVVYAYPMTGVPGTPLPDGWDEIPGARGCTPQSCSFRDHMAELKSAGADHVFGVSTQTTEYQKEAADRLHLPFDILSDADLTLQRAMRLPIMDADVGEQNHTLLKRLALIAKDGVIKKCFYPVFPPDRNAADVLEWLKQNSL